MRFTSYAHMYVHRVTIGHLTCRRCPVIEMLRTESAEIGLPLVSDMRRAISAAVSRSAAAQEHQGPSSAASSSKSSS
jgi:hypothetical protein